MDLKKNYWKIVLGMLFALAAAWGLLQRNTDPYAGFSKKTYSFKNPTATNKSLGQYYNEAATLGKNPTTPRQASFIATGDIMLSRHVAEKIKAAGDPAAPFYQINNTLQSADFSFGNLESPIVYGPGTLGGNSLIFAASSSTLDGLVKTKFKVLNLANNHALDQGIAGLESTVQFLDGLGIEHIGAGQDQAAAWQPAKVEIDGITICFIGASYASVNDGGKAKNNFVARMEDLGHLKTGIFSLRPSCDFIVASMHAGTEYTRTPNQAQTAFARAAIDAGADMVIGGHPHWVQSVEKYQGKYIFYSLGNFIFDQMWSQETREGLILKINLEKTSAENSGLQGPKSAAGLQSVELLPIIIDNYSAPRLANETESAQILKKIGLTEKTLH
ncbi:MAG: CapA family protein [Patescibacteria group bacterium]|nr:CapA family protein [Patescibacteria group bacterium]